MMTIWLASGKTLPQVDPQPMPPHQIGTAVNMGFALNGGFARVDGHPVMDYPATTWSPPQAQVQTQPLPTDKVVRSVPATPTRLTGN